MSCIRDLKCGNWILSGELTKLREINVSVKIPQMVRERGGSYQDRGTDLWETQGLENQGSGG